MRRTSALLCLIFRKQADKEAELRRKEYSTMPFAEVAKEESRIDTAEE